MDLVTRRQGAGRRSQTSYHVFSLSPYLLVSLSPRLFVSLSPLTPSPPHLVTLSSCHPDPWSLLIVRQTPVGPRDPNRQVASQQPQREQHRREHDQREQFLPELGQP